MFFVPWKIIDLITFGMARAWIIWQTFCVLMFQLNLTSIHFGVFKLKLWRPGFPANIPSCRHMEFDPPVFPYNLTWLCVICFFGTCFKAVHYNLLFIIDWFFFVSGSVITIFSGSRGHHKSKPYPSRVPVLWKKKTCVELTSEYCSYPVVFTWNSTLFTCMYMFKS